MSERRRVLLVGGGDLAGEVCEALEAGGGDVKWLSEADDESVREALGSMRPDIVCVATRDDAFPLRMALLVRHIDEDVPLLVTIFDPGIAEQIADAVPNCKVTSLADIVAPTLAGPCIDPDLVAVRRKDGRGFGLDEQLEEVDLPPQQPHRVRSLVTAFFHPYDRSAALLIYGFAGLVLMLCFELFGAMIVLDQGFADAFYGSTKSLATVGPNTDVADGPKWFKVAIGMLGDPHAAVGRVVHGRPDQPLRRLEPDRAVRQARGAAPRSRDRDRARAGRAAAVPAAARVRRARGRRRRRPGLGDRRARPAAEDPGRDRPRREPGRAAAALARSRRVRSAR